jgi:chromate reductase
MGASPGMLGSARAQYHLRQVFIFMDGKILNKPEVMIAGAMGKFDAEGKLTDEPTRQAIAAQLVALKAWTLQLRP